MSFNNYNIKSLKLQEVIVEPILLSFINGVIIYELSLEIQTILPMPYRVLKKYLYYLMNYDLFRMLNKKPYS